MDKIDRNINLDRAALGIELGSTRIKAVLTDERGRTLAVGAFGWENRYEDGLWTYGYDEIFRGLRECYAAIKASVKSTYGITLRRVGAMGVSAMMHGYLPLGADGEPLAAFRTWRNNNAEGAAKELSGLFGFHIPARWSIAHLYQAMLDGEEHLPRLASLTTLAGYVHRALTGVNAVGVGEASGIFPIDSSTKNYDGGMIGSFDALAAKMGMPWKTSDVLPAVLLAGAEAGRLTEQGAKLLDADGDLEAGVPLCAPEGDAGTGMTATNSVRPRTGNVSAGTSVFGMFVTGRPLAISRDEIDIVTTPTGDDVAMVHCNNCSSDFNAWAGIFGEFAEEMGEARPEVHRLLCEKSLEGEPDCGGVINYNYVSGENITDVAEGRPLVARKAESRLTLANFARSMLYSSFATLCLGINILKDAGVAVDSVIGHGGLFRTEGVCQRYLAAALNAPVTVTDTAGEGGAYGMALLAEYMLVGRDKTLAEWLDDIFAGAESITLTPKKEDVEGFAAYMREFEKGLPIVRTAVSAFAEKTAPTLDERLKKLKKDVFDANLQLVKNGLVIYTWGNVSGIDRESGLVVIKPSGVDYDGMTADDMVVVDMDGRVVEGAYKPSSDTPTHLELYKAHPEIGGVVHTHSTYATAFAQAGRGVPAYGTTHADYFYGDVPCTRALTEAEIADGYERNTGVVINELLVGADDPLAVPAAVVKNHGPFAWGKDAANAVYNATVLEQVARMASITEGLNKTVKRADKFLLDKHYFRKHGKNAYYGQ